MDNQAISKLLRNVAVAYTIKDEKKYRFQIIAYNNASETIETMTTQIRDLVKEDSLKNTPGIGTSIRGHLEELFKTGKVKHFEEMMKDLPQAMFPLLDIPSFGPKKAYKLVTIFDLKNPESVVSDIEQLANEHKISDLEGFGKKSEDLILQAIAEYKLGKSKDIRMTLPFANELAEKLIAYMKTIPATKQIYPLGSLRRKMPTIGDIDLAVSTDDPETVLNHFAAYPYKERLLQQGKNESSFLTAGNRRVDLRTISEENFGALLQHFTGSKNHNVALREYALRNGLSISEYGIKKKEDDSITTYTSEEKFYEALGMDWVPPEMRENTGEIEQALKHQLPVLVELKDIKGDFHIHSSFPIEPSHDLGADPIETLMKRAQELGYEYLGLSEHNPGVSTHTSEQIFELVNKRNKEIDRLASMNKYNVRIFKLLETDILANGGLAIDEKTLSILDGTLVSIHSSFNMSKEDMTQRILNGLSHPKAKIFAHPTTRMINQRNGIDADWEAIMKFCKEHNKALEINSAPLRLDLPDVLVREAVKLGVKLIIDTDSHSIDGMDLMQYGVFVARRGWATTSDILNTMSYNEIAEWLKD